MEDYFFFKKIDKRLKRIEKLLKFLVEQNDDRLKAKELTAIVDEKATALGAAIPRSGTP